MDDGVLLVGCPDSLGYGERLIERGGGGFEDLPEEAKTVLSSKGFAFGAYGHTTRDTAGGINSAKTDVAEFIRIDQVVVMSVPGDEDAVRIRRCNASVLPASWLHAARLSSLAPAQRRAVESLANQLQDQQTFELRFSSSDRMQQWLRAMEMALNRMQASKTFVGKQSLHRHVYRGARGTGWGKITRAEVV